MPTRCYVDTEFRTGSKLVIEQANEIIETYLAQGYDLTLRQLYYQFVSRNYLRNTIRNYKRLGSIVNDARLAGLIDWNAICDRTREVRILAMWDSPEERVAYAAKHYLRDKWDTQPYYIEVWIEKEALAGVFERVCDELEVPLLSCRGYTSQSEMWRASQRLLRKIDAGKEAVVLHFGDHDPSGIDMTRDIQERLQMFQAEVDVRRLALNQAQVDQYSPPPNPAKETDSRFTGYQKLYGEESWELDALEPDVLASLVRDEILDLRDDDLWEEAEEQEEKERQQIVRVAQHWADVVKGLPRVRRKK